MGDDSYTYTKDRILDINHPEEPYSQKADIVLDNSDGALTDLDLQGFQAVISYGAITSAGEEYNACAPLWVIAPTFSSIEKLTCSLSLIGIPNLMAQDQASAAYQPDETDTNVAKTLIDAIAGATLACFSHCTAYETEWEVGYNALADTYQPKDSFRVYTGGNRLSALRRLLEATGNVMRVKADGKIHIFAPVTTGETYSYEYSLESGHAFFAKSFRKRLVIPNYIVVKSQTNDDPQVDPGIAIDTDSNDLIDKRAYYQTRLADHTQATAIAEALLLQQQLWSDAGAADVPMNVGAEVWDYVKVGALNSEDVYRVGNLGHLARHYNAVKKEWRMTMSFGNWMTVQKALASLGISSDDLEAYFSRLKVKDAYIENLLVTNLDAYWIDPEGNIDFDAIETADGMPNMDQFKEGETFCRTRWLHLDGETGLTMKESQIYCIRFTPDSDEVGIRRQDAAPTAEAVGEYWIDTSGASPVIKRWTGSAWATIDQAEIDMLNAGILTVHTKLAALSVDGLVLLDEVKIGDDYDLISKTYISAGRLYLSSVIQSADYRTLSDAEKATYGAKAKVFRQTTPPATGMVAGDIWIDTDNGDAPYTYSGTGWVAAYTEIDGGHITTGIIDCSLVTIQTAGGTTRLELASTGLRGYNAGVLQVKVSASDGKLYAGAGAVILDATGAHFRGSTTLDLSYSGSYTAYIFVDAAGRIYLNPALYGGYRTLFVNGLIITPNTGGIVLGTTGASYEGVLTMQGSGGNDLYIYTGGALRTNG